MVARLRSVLKNPVSPLVLRAGLLSLAIFWLRSGGGAIRALIFLGALAVFYLKPSINASKFLVSTAVLVLVILLTPLVGGAIGFYTNIILGLSIFMLLGVKNLIFVRRQNIYYWLHLMLIVGVSGLFFLNSLSQVVLFLSLCLLLREFHLVISSQDANLINWLAAAEAMILAQLAWVIKFFPAGFLINSSFLVLATFAMDDILLNHFRGTLNRQIIWRNILILILTVSLILLLPVWGFR